MTATLAQTPLHAWHAGHGGRMVDFAGWSMPVQYGSIVAEHQAVRRRAGLFDVSHMGRLRFEGPDAAQFLDRLVTRRVDDLPPGQIRYALVTNDAGGIRDDVLVYHLASRDGGTYYGMVVNASNREKIVAWIHQKLGDCDLECIDTTHEQAMIAVQGPLAERILQPMVDVSLAELGYYTGSEALIHEHPGIVSRTGYTGEDGFELIVPAAAAEAVWEQLLDNGRNDGVIAAGLGARDTLRLEAGMPLYGHELSEEITPLQAGLNFAVNFEGRDFPGCSVLTKFKQATPEWKRVGLELTGKRVPREHYPVVKDGRPIGEVTSGTFSPTLERPIAMAYVKPSITLGAEVHVDIRGTLEAAKVVKLPFYRRAK